MYFFFLLFIILSFLILEYLFCHFKVTGMKNTMANVIWGFKCNITAYIYTFFSTLAKTLFIVWNGVNEPYFHLNWFKRLFSFLITRYTTCRKWRPSIIFYDVMSFTSKWCFTRSEHFLLREKQLSRMRRCFCKYQ